MYNESTNTQRKFKMLFRKKIEKSCTYCLHGTRLEDGKILCSKKGLRSEDKACFQFRYDPLKRIPGKMKALDFSKYDQEDYSL